MLQSKALSKVDGTPVLAASIEESKTANKKSRNSNKETSQESDSFYKYYNKEIKVNQEEIPIVLYELVDAAYNYIQRESYEKALILLQKTEGVLEVVNLEGSKRDKYIAYTTFHNMAMCYQKLGMLEECFIYLKESLSILMAPLPPGQHFYKYNTENCIAARMKQLRQECKLKLQLCAILSQTQNHMEALDNAKKSVKLVHQLFKDLIMLCALNIKKIEKKQGAGKEEEESKAPSDSTSMDENFLEDSISMLEKTSLKLYPIVKEVLKRMIEEVSKEKKRDQVLSSKDFDLEKLMAQDDSETFQGTGPPDMRSVLGFLNQNEWVFALNIGNIMQLQPVSLKNDLLSQCRNECELTRDAFLEKIALLSVSYFCVSTEMRFILQSREQYLSSPVKRQRELESEYWHAKSLEVACTFLPSECPLLNHILLSYQKHHDPSQQPIKEDQEQTDVLTVIRPMAGIESNKYQPIVRQITTIKVAITPCPISPITKRIFNRSNKVPKPAQIAPTKANEKEEPTIVMYDQAEELPPVRPAENSINTASAVAWGNKLQSVSLYSDDYYDQFVKKILDENPQLDKKILVTRLLSHLHSQDYSFLQRQINEQHQMADDEDEELDLLMGDSVAQGRSNEVQKEQRRTLMHFENEDDFGDVIDHGGEDMLDVEDILLEDQKPFDIIQQLRAKKQGPSQDAALLQEELEGVLRQRDAQKGYQYKEGGRKVPISALISGSGSGPSGSSSGKNTKQGKLSGAHTGSLQKPASLSQSKDSSSSGAAAQKKKREPNRMQKLMSYLEGDSLLKEIEKSLENHNRVNLHESLFEEDLDDINHSMGPVLPDDVKDLQSKKSGLKKGIRDLEDDRAGYEADLGGNEGRHLRPLEIDSSDLDDQEAVVIHPASDSQTTNTAKNRSSLLKGHTTNTAGAAVDTSKDSGSGGKGSLLKPKKQLTAQSNLKSSGSQTRPSSSITNHTSATVGVRKFSQSFLHRKQRKLGTDKSAEQQLFQSQQHSQPDRQFRGSSGSPMSSSRSPRVQSEGRQVAMTSINAADKKPIPKKVLTKGAAGGARPLSAQKRNKNQQLLTQQSNYKTQVKKSLQSGSKKERSKSRLSNHAHFKSIGNNQLHHQSFHHKGRSSQLQLHAARDRRSAENKLRAKSKSSEEAGRSSSSQNRQSRGMKRRDTSAEANSIQHDNPESVTPGVRDIPLLFQPSFSEHTNTGSKNKLGHNYSLDVSGLPSKNLQIMPHKNLRKDGNQSLNNLQKQVLLNQKLLLQFQEQQQQAQNNSRSQSGARQSRKVKKAEEAAASMDNTQKRGPNMRSRSIAGNFIKKPSGSMATTANIKQRMTHHQTSMDQNHISRQGLWQMQPAGSAFSSKQPLQYQSRQSNKENLVNKPSQLAGRKSNTSAAKKMSIKDLMIGLQAQQKYQSRDNQSRTKLDGHDRQMKSFFDNNSPQLLRKKKKTGSHSPPKKQQSASLAKSSQKATCDLRNLVSGIASRQMAAGSNINSGGVNPAKIIFATTDSRSRALQNPKKRGSFKNQKQLHSSFMQQLQDDENQHSHSWWLLPENNTSFDAIVKSSIIGPPQQLTSEDSSVGGSNVKRGGSKLAHHANQLSAMLDQHRPSFGVGPLHRGSSDIINLQTSSLSKPQNSLHSFTSNPIESSVTQPQRDLRSMLALNAQQSNPQIAVIHNIPTNQQKRATTAAGGSRVEKALKLNNLRA